MMADSTKFTATSIEPPTLAEEEGTGNLHVQVLLSDSGGSKLLLALPAELSFLLAGYLYPTDLRASLAKLYSDHADAHPFHNLHVKLYPDDAPKPT